MDFLRELLGAVLYFSGSAVIVFPGIAYFENFHTPGKLLRAVEKLEADGVDRRDCGFREIKQELNSILEGDQHLGESVDRLDLHAGTVTTSRGALLKLRAHEGEDENYKIDDPLFVKIRYQIDRTIRRGKTRIRTVGLFLTVLGFTVQMWPELTEVIEYL